MTGDMETLFQDLVRAAEEMRRVNRMGAGEWVMVNFGPAMPEGLEPLIPRLEEHRIFIEVRDE